MSILAKTKASVFIDIKAVMYKNVTRTFSGELSSWSSVRCPATNQDLYLPDPREIKIKIRSSLVVQTTGLAYSVELWLKYI